MVLNPELRQIIESQADLQKKEFKKNEILFYEGDSPSGIYCIKSGKVKIVKNQSKDYKRIVHLASKGEILGLHAVVNNQPYTNTAIAIDKTKTLFLAADEFLELVETDNAYKFLVMKTLCSRIDTMEHHLNLISEKQTEQRFADTLVMLIHKYGLKKHKTLNITLSLDDLASYTCTSHSYMKKIVLEFAAKKLISYHNGVIGIIDRKKILSVASNERKFAEI